MLAKIQYWPIIRPIIALLSSRKFLVALVPVIAHWGFDLTPELMTAITAIAAVLIGSIAAEDYAAKRGA